MTRFPRGIRFVAILGVIALSGCNRSPPAPVVEEQPADSPGSLVRCFPDGGALAFTVSGVPVPEKTVDRFAEYYKDLGVLNPDQAKAMAIDQAILMTAAVYSDLKGTPGRLEEWSSRVKAVDARLRAGEDFATVAKTASGAIASEIGPFRRDQNFPPLSQAAFGMKVGDISPPIVTIYGANFIKLTGVVNGVSPEKDQRKASHILIAFDPAVLASKEAWDQKCHGLKKDAQVDQVKEPYKKLIPASHRR
jgi:hypothetical protein